MSSPANFQQSSGLKLQGVFGQHALTSAPTRFRGAEYSRPGVGFKMRLIVLSASDERLLFLGQLDNLQA
jgi:hypothetical protein